MPFIPKTIGNKNTAPISKTRVFKNEITADTKPLFKAVKNAEPNILNPPIVNDIAKILSVLTVKFNSSGLSPTKIRDKGITIISPAFNL